MRVILSIIFALSCLSLSAQNQPERGELRRGNSEFNDGDYPAAIEHYERSLELSPSSFDAGYNLGNAHYRAEDLPKAEQQLAAMATDSLRLSDDRADAYYNLGNSQFQQQKLEEALESYKSSLRLRPDDMECKYNYAYTKKLLEQQQENEDEQEQDENEDQQDQDEQDQEQNQDQQDQDQNEEEQEQDQQQDEGDEEQEQDQQPQPQDGEISQQEQDQILDAIQAQEDKTQDKLDEMRRGVVIPGRKSW